MNSQQPLRVWPGVAAVVVQWIAWMVVPVVAPDLGLYALFAALALGPVVIVWWLFFSRAAWMERIGALVLIVAVVAATALVVHPSISNGMMGLMLPLYSIPAMSLALVAWAVIARGMTPGGRRVALVAIVVMAGGVFTVLRTEGITGAGASQLHWRWTASPEEILLAQAAEMPPPPAAAVAPVPVPVSAPSADASPAPPAAVPASVSPVAASPEAAPPADPESATALAPAADPAPRAPAWPGFRGPARDGISHAPSIETDWTRVAPLQLWRRPIGPGWSSFAVDGDAIYTQEQRGDEEVVSAYRLSTGAPIWMHRDPVRFWESNGGAGPRGTPTLHNGRVYAVGATGILNALDARSGARLWSRDTAADTGRAIPDWGFSSSPLIVDDLVVVAAAGMLAAYDAATGAPRWKGPQRGSGYSSPQLAVIDGVRQIVLLSGAGAVGVAPRDGAVLWTHDHRSDGIVQPAVVGNDMLIGGSSMGDGLRRIAVMRSGDGWNAEERWTSRGLKPYFNDFVIHEGHAYGFDGSILSCIDLADGSRKWKGGRYGHGQMVLLPEQDLLLVLSEDGELALVQASADRYTEVARVPAIEGKTWNHPVVIGDMVLVRNGEEMAAFRLASASR